MSRIAFALAVCLAVPISAQDLESFGGLRIRFDAPGARTAAMGGASEAMSDAFSVATNPAGLARQTDRLFAIEARQTSNETEFLTGGAPGAFTSSSFDTNARHLGGAVVILPTRIANFALSYDEPLNLSRDTHFLRSTVENPFGVGFRDGEVVPLDACVNPNGPSTCDFTSFFSSPAILPVNAEVRVRRYGAAAARAFGRVALGASMQYATMLEDVSTVATRQFAHDSDFTWNAGAQVELTRTIRFGASYRSGAEIRGDRVFDYVDRGPVKFTRNFATPSSFAAGLAADVTPNFTVAFDAVRVNYSELNWLPHFDGPPAPDTLEMPDVTELRAGAEYRLGTRVPVALRAGWWLEPAHRVQAFGGIFPGVSDVTNAIMLRDQDESHITAGIGIGDRVRFDAAIDRSENTTRASMGVATTF